MNFCFWYQLCMKMESGTYINVEVCRWLQLKCPFYRMVSILRQKFCSEMTEITEYETMGYRIHGDT